MYKKNLTILIFFLTSLSLIALLRLSSPAAASRLGQMDHPNTGRSSSGAFFYNGFLTYDGVPINGSCDFDFNLWDAAIDGQWLGQQQVLGLTVTDGHYSALLNRNGEFGAAPFTGQPRWLEISTQCGTKSVVASPRVALTAVPYAFSLQPGAIVSATLANDSTLTLSNNAARGVALAIPQAGDMGVHVASANGDGMYIDNVGGDGLAVNTAGNPESAVSSLLSNGLEVAGAAGHGLYVGHVSFDGVHVLKAGDDGFHITQADDNGLEVTHADGSGIHVQEAAYGFSVSQADFDGLSVGNTGLHGVNVNWAGYHGINVAWAAYDGIHVNSADDDGLEVDHADDNGVDINWANNAGLYVEWGNYYGIDVDGGYLAGYFDGNIQVAGSCSGCSLTIFGINAGERPLQPGDIVSLQGTRTSHVDSVPLLLEVGLATEGDNIIGVVQGNAEPVATKEPRPDEIGLRLIPGGGEAAPGAFVTILTHGLAQVHAQALHNAIHQGDRLTINQNGQARPLATITLDGIELAEDAAVLGIALEPLTSGKTDKIWVLINPR